MFTTTTSLLKATFFMMSEMYFSAVFSFICVLRRAKAASMSLAAGVLP